MSNLFLLCEYCLFIRVIYCLDSFSSTIHHLLQHQEKGKIIDALNDVIVCTLHNRPLG